jgi:hypothetical protein
MREGCSDSQQEIKMQIDKDYNVIPSDRGLGDLCIPSRFRVEIHHALLAQFFLLAKFFCDK